MAAQPPPRVLEPAASKAADFTAFDHVGAASWVPRAAASPISADRDSVLYPRAPCPLRLVLETAGIVRVLSGHCQGSVHESVRALSSELELGTQKRVASLYVFEFVLTVVRGVPCFMCREFHWLFTVHMEINLNCQN